ncbi:hypothetical protein PQO03_00320 [Lentisphaera profundi]|uniref:DUF4203 domain-containing protein n=1 Tax=Lentisphaera profundi TaxID=1658616 RepID=A0ABY7VQE9_9BACT|nr:hypothetical protein [Lentisphaera profundi]WDE96411.1 hypothetical protein PQO03_00320 [Lentisphaera profundi]
METIIDQLDSWIIYTLPLLSLLFIFKGLKMFKALLAIGCALSLGLLGWLLGLQIDENVLWIPCTIAAIAAIFGLWLSKVVHSAATFILGSSVAFMLYPSIQSFVPDDPNWLPFAATATLSLFFGMIAAMMKDKVVVLITSIYGAALFTHSFFLILSLHDILDQDLLTSQSKTFHIIWLSLFVILTAAGLFSQGKKKS